MLSESRYCVTSNNSTGFLCDDRITCLLPSQVCNSASDCGNGEDEATSLCSDLPNNLPGYLIFRCGNPQFWIYSNLKCNGINNCGDCSDESPSFASCSFCQGSWWTCTPVLYQYCYCIPTSLCRNGVQDCVNWSDEYICQWPALILWLVYTFMYSAHRSSWFHFRSCNQTSDHVQVAVPQVTGKSPDSWDEDIGVTSLHQSPAFLNQWCK